ncbi:LegC family aminotransferase [Pseudomonadota bacterium]
MSLKADDILNAVTGALGPVDAFTPLHEPEFSGNESKYVQDCIDTGWVSSVGAYVDRIEADLCAYTGAKHAVAMVNGTAALHMSLIVAGVEAGDEVIAPSLSFVATANAIAYCHATPHFVDIEASTLGLDAAKLDAHLTEVADKTSAGVINKQTGKRIACVVCMHTFGHPVDLDALIAVCDRWDLTLVEDAAESLGSKYKDKHCGTFGRVAAVSFNGNKVVTTGGGGALLTNDEDLAKRAKHLSTTAKTPHPWLYVHNEVGYNYRMPNINAALGCAQLEQLNGFVAEKRELTKRYADAFAGLDGVKVFTETDFASSNYWLNAIILDDASLRDLVLEALNGANYMSRPAWTLLHKLAPFANGPRMSDLSVAGHIEDRLINIPSSPKLVRA